MDAKQLLTVALSKSQELSKKIGTDIYQSISFQGFKIPELNIEVFERRAIGILKSENKLSERTVVSVQPFPLNDEILGIVLYLNNNRIDIHPSANLNKWKERLVVCKELCQIYLDFTESNPADGSNHVLFREIRKQIFELITLHNETAAHFDQLDLAIDDKNRNEFLSFFMAINMIFPPERWSDFKILYEKTTRADGGLTLYDMAYAYQMPRFALKFFRKRMLPYYEK